MKSTVSNMSKLKSVFILVVEHDSDAEEYVGVFKTQTEALTHERVSKKRGDYPSEFVFRVDQVEWRPK